MDGWTDGRWVVCCHVAFCEVGCLLLLCKQRQQNAAMWMYVTFRVMMQVAGPN
jgi:hypothetical protein